MYWEPFGVALVLKMLSVRFPLSAASPLPPSDEGGGKATGFDGGRDDWERTPALGNTSAFSAPLSLLRRQLPRGTSHFYFLCPTVGEGLAPPALRTLPCWRKFKPPSDEGGGKTAGFDGGREN